MQALGKYVLLKEDKLEQRETALGLLTTAVDLESERYKNATVVLAGPDCTESVVVGSKVAYDSAQGHNITIDDVVYRVVLEGHLAVVF